MKKLLPLALLLLIFSTLSAQKVDYKEGLVSVDKQPVARITGTKNAALASLVKDYAVTNLEGKQLFTAIYSDLIPEDPNDNLSFYFEFRFEGLETPAYLPVSKLGGDKTIANHIGNFGLVKNQELDLYAVRALILKKGKTPPYRLKYTMVTRNRQFPIEIREAGQISQASTVVGLFKDQGTQSGLDTYAFQVPDGTTIAIATFAGGNNASNVKIKTLLDNVDHNISTAGDPIQQIAAIDRNYFIVKKIAKWLVDSGYL